MVMRFPEMVPDITSAVRSAVASRSRFTCRGGLVRKAHRLLYHSTLGSRMIKRERELHLPPPLPPRAPRRPPPLADPPRRRGTRRARPQPLASKGRERAVAVGGRGGVPSGLGTGARARGEELPVVDLVEGAGLRVQG